MSGRGGGSRDRFRRENSSSCYEENHSGRSSAPPSRHLWVGKLSHDIIEDDLIRHFSRFGDLDSVAFQPGRVYAFINYKMDDDAIAAFKALQGLPVAGNPLRIEFAKADKSSSASHGEEYQDGRHSAFRGSSYQQKESRARPCSPEPSYRDKHKTNDKSVEPSEVLWIGFPASLKVDEKILRKAFSPFGEIEKITTFPGHSYAFVRFRSVISARKAKDTLQGKLFGNPRVNICFAKSEGGSSKSGKSSINDAVSSHSTSNGHIHSLEKFTGDSDLRSPHFVSDLDSGEYDTYNFNRRDSLRICENNAFDHRRLGEMGSELGPLRVMYEHHIGSVRDQGSNLNDMPERFHKRPIYEEEWDLPADASIFHVAKKLKTSSFPLDKELPEYPFSELLREKSAYPRFPSHSPEDEAFHKSFKFGPIGAKLISDQRVNFTLSHGERSDGSVPSHPSERKRFTPEFDPPSVKEWKWEGTIAKGGRPVCRARCFPVGKVMDVMLPEFVDCTARTSLFMLAKHYYQAAGAWVVFFVPESDAEIRFYSEFMHHLEEKQRAAVSILDGAFTLFLVPPSEFSEKVLKVPGKLSISGVVLRLNHASTNYGTVQENDRRGSDVLPCQVNTSYTKSSTILEPFQPAIPVRNQSFSGDVAISAPPRYSGPAHGDFGTSNSYNDILIRQENPRSRPDWPPYPEDATPGARNAPTQASITSIDPSVQASHMLMPRMAQQSNYSHQPGQNPEIALPGEGKSHNPGTKPRSSLPLPLSLQPDQLAQLAPSLLGQQRQLGGTPKVSVETSGHSNVMNQSQAAQKCTLQNNQATSEPAVTHLGQAQLQQNQHVSSIPAAPQTVQREPQMGSQVSQQTQGTGLQEGEADPQKRLQATLQLAAALLQQIKGNNLRSTGF